MRRQKHKITGVRVGGFGKALFNRVQQTSQLVYRRYRRISFFARTALGVLGLAAVVALSLTYYQHQLYALSPAEHHLLSKSSVDLTKIKETPKAFEYNRSDAPVGFAYAVVAKGRIVAWVGEKNEARSIASAGLKMSGLASDSTRHRRLWLGSLATRNNR